jgi:hypothetical protein
MGKLEDAATSEELAPPSNKDWTFDELPQARRAEGEGTMVLSSAGNHMISVPNHGLVRKSPPALQARTTYPIFGKEHNHDVDYTDDSPNEDGGAALESPALSSEDNNPAIIQNDLPTTFVQAKHDIESNGKEEAQLEARLVMGAGATTIAKRNQVLTQAIMSDLAATKQIRLRTSLLGHTQQQAGLEEDVYGYDELDGYTSPGGTIRMDKKLTTVMFIAVAAETPNKLLLKAREEAYELVTTQAKDLLEKQRKAYEDKCARMAEEHQRCMERMKAESDKMLEEASKVRQEYAQAFLLEEPLTIRKIEEFQAHICYDSLSEQLEFKTQRLQNDYESEKKKRVRKEEDLKDAEDQITKLQQDLKRLEDILERSSKRSVPLRGKNDSPELQPSKKKQIVEVQANAAAIIKQQVEVKNEIESAGSAIIRQEPELRLDTLGDIVSNEVELPVPPTPSEITRQIFEARRKAKLGESERIALVERGKQVVEARRKALVVTKTTTNITKSPSPERYLGYKAAQYSFHDIASVFKGHNRRVSPTPDLFQHYNAARDAHLSDGELGVMALEAWRNHLRKKHEYLPDRDIASSVHLDHLKVLSSALTDFKRQQTALNLWEEGAVSYKHERYSVICQKYRIPSEVCIPKELMRSVERKDMNMLYQKRCCQLNKFYSMLLKDTPGYIPAPDYKERGPQSRATEPKPVPPIRKNPAINHMAEELTPISGWVRHLS